MNEREIRRWARYVAAPGSDEPRAEATADAAQSDWRRRFEAGARVRPRGRHRVGTIARVVDRDGAGVPAYVEVRWDGMHDAGVYQWPIDFLRLVEDDGEES